MQKAGPAPGWRSHTNAPSKSRPGLAGPRAVPSWLRCFSISALSCSAVNATNRGVPVVPEVISLQESNPAWQRRFRSAAHGVLVRAGRLPGQIAPRPGASLTTNSSAPGPTAETPAGTDPLSRFPLPLLVRQRSTAVPPPNHPRPFSCEQDRATCRQFLIQHCQLT